MDDIKESYHAVKYLYIIWRTVKKTMPTEDKLKVLTLMREDLKRMFKEDVKIRIVRKIKDWFIDEIICAFNRYTNIWVVLVDIFYKLFDIVDTITETIRTIIVLAQGIAIVLLNQEINDCTWSLWSQE